MLRIVKMIVSEVEPAHIDATTKLLVPTKTRQAAHAVYHEPRADYHWVVMSSVVGGDTQTHVFAADAEGAMSSIHPVVASTRSFAFVLLELERKHAEALAVVQARGF